MMSPPRAPFLTSSMLSSGKARFKPSSMASSSTSPCNCCEPCFHPALGRGQLRHGVIQFLLQLRLLQLRLFLFLGARLGNPISQLGVDLLLDVQRQGVFFVLELLALPAQLQLFVPQCLQLCLAARELFLHRVQLRLERLLSQSPHIGQCLGMRIGLRLDHALHVLDLPLCDLGLLAGQLLGPLLDAGPFLVPKRRQGADTGRFHGFQGMPGEALLQGEFMIARGARDPRFGGKKQGFVIHLAHCGILSDLGQGCAARRCGTLPWRSNRG